MIKYILLLLLFLSACNPITLHAGDFPGTDAEHKCMELAEFNCVAVERCRGIPRNICMMTAYTNMCSRVEKIGPGFHDCLLFMKRYKCGEPKIDEACHKAFLGKVK